ncbi:MAG: hypothetical protein RQ864_12105 [Lutibacter sp.]|nr:hypothetical protein [Lutibacter sp.]
MKTIENTYKSPEKIFTVTINDINTKNELHLNILYNEIENFVLKIVSDNFYVAHPIPSLYKLQLLKNAFLNDQLLIKSKIIKFRDLELQLLISVINHNPEDENLICNAVFKFDLISAISEAS